MLGRASDSYDKGAKLASPDDNSNDAKRNSTESIDVICQNEGIRFSCDVCMKLFRSQVTLARHKKRHTTNLNDDAISGKHIQKRLRKRQKTENNSEHLEVDLRCHICQKEFLSKETLAKHKKRHTSAFFCKSCTQGFNDKDSYEEHMNMRHEMVRFQCHICDKLFRQKRSLLCHIMAHTGGPLLTAPIT